MGTHGSASTLTSGTEDGTSASSRRRPRSVAMTETLPGIRERFGHLLSESEIINLDRFMSQDLAKLKRAAEKARLGITSLRGSLAGSVKGSLRESIQTSLETPNFEEEEEPPSHLISEPRPLKQDEVNRYKEVFMLFDRQGDETITNNELGTVMRALGQYPTEGEMNSIIHEIDADGNGIIEFPEFVDLMSRRPPGRQGSKEELRKAFAKALDREKTGKVDISHFRYTMTRFAEILNDEQVTELTRLLLPDGDGCINYEIIVQMLNEELKGIPQPKLQN